MGYHELMGAKVRLKKPLLVLKKVEIEDDGGGDEDSKKVELDVIGVIRNKILFKTRPKALISSKRLTSPHTFLRYSIFVPCEFLAIV